MPFYEYSCGCGRVAVERRGYDASTIPCVCGAAMWRAAFNCPELIGETVPKHGAKPGMPRDRHGRYRLDLFQEAHEELAEAGVPTQQIYRRAVEQAKRR